MAVRIFLICFLGAVLSTAAQKADHSLLWEGDFATAITLPQKFTDLSVRLEGSKKAITGKTSVQDGVTIFKPVIPFTNGLNYSVFEGKNLVLSFTPTLKKSQAPTVIAVYPQSTSVPDNLLKFYIQFDQPMEVGRIYDYLHLYSGDREVENAFVPLSPELWNDANDMVTIWLDPGRIKRDLEPNKRFGQVLQSGKSYKLIIDKEFRSRAGKALGEPIERLFSVQDRDETIPLANDIEFFIPKSGTKNALRIHFNEPMDHAMLSMMSLFDAIAKIEGTWESINDNTYQFFPLKNWQSGMYELVLDAQAEDLAGNNFNRLFDTDLTLDQTPGTAETVSKVFQVK